MEIDPLKELKSVARKIARARSIKHVSALSIVAKSLGFPHWNALTVAKKKGWLPSVDNAVTAQALLAAVNSTGSIDSGSTPGTYDEPATGEIQGHAYQVSDTLDDTFVRGRGWEVILPEAPLGSSAVPGHR